MRRGESVPGAFQAPVDVHASVDGQVYMFNNKQDESAASSDDDEDDEEEEEGGGMEMRTRALLDRARPGNVELLEKDVLDGDNLNNLALKYGCKVADLKRVNNLMQEQDLFALKSIKIPVQKHSFLMEEYSDARQETSAPPGNPSGRARSQQHLPEVTDFLMEVDNDIEKLIQNSGDRGFFNFSERRLRFAQRAQGLICHGADWGIHWWNAVVAMFLIVIVLPLFYVIYFKTKSGEEALTGHVLQPTSAANSSGKDFSTTASNPG